MQQLKGKALHRAMLNVHANCPVVVMASKIKNIPRHQLIIIDDSDSSHIQNVLRRAGVSFAQYEVFDKDFTREQFIPLTN